MKIIELNTNEYEKLVKKGLVEEDKKIEKLGYFDLTIDKNEKDENGKKLELNYTGVADTFDEVYDKINELIDKVNSLENK